MTLPSRVATPRDEAPPGLVEPGRCVWEEPRRDRLGSVGGATGQRTVRVRVLDAEAATVPDPAYCATSECLPFRSFGSATTIRPLSDAFSVARAMTRPLSVTTTLPIGAADDETVTVTLALPEGVTFQAALVADVALPVLLPGVGTPGVVGTGVVGAGVVGAGVVGAGVVGAGVVGAGVVGAGVVGEGAGAAALANRPTYGVT